MIELTQELLKEWVQYNHETGIFTWKRHIKPNKIGKVVGSFTHGYLETYFPPTRKNYSLHRLAWLYLYGKWPDYDIDHINGDRADNRLENLRDVSRKLNSHNSSIRKNNTTGFPGVVYIKTTGKFRAGLRVKGKVRHLGVFETAEKAFEAYQKAKLNLLVDLANVNS